jgi:hypothetical protein
MIFTFGTSIAAAFLIDSFLTNIYGFIAIYCVMIGVSSGLIYMLPVCNISHLNQYAVGNIFQIIEEQFPEPLSQATDLDRSSLILCVLLS